VSFSTKRIEVQFSLASGQFEGGGNTASNTGIRVSFQAEITGAPSLGTATMAIYGLPEQMMQQLSTVGPQWNARYKNGIDILAGDDDSGMSVVFSGIIFNALIDAAQMPQVALRINAAPGAFESVNTAKPTSINGSADAAGMISTLASQMGFSFENNGVTAKLANPYYAGSAWDQMIDIAYDGNFDLCVDCRGGGSGKPGTIVISDPGKPRSGDAPLIAPWTTMASYPSFVQNQLIVRSLFNPAVKPLGSINVQSELQPACGTWQVIKIDHDLDTITPSGNWFSTYTCVPLGTQP
jgi:hypothetical protein